MEISIEYFELLNEYKKEFQEKYNCPHHLINKDLALIANPIDYDKKKYTQDFFTTWFYLSFIDQIVYRHFNNQYSTWIKLYGSIPIPMEGAGMGCIKYTSPTILIHNLNKDDCKKAISDLVFFTKKTISILQIDLFHFFNKILNDEITYKDKHKNTLMLRKELSQQYSSSN